MKSKTFAEAAKKTTYGNEEEANRECRESLERAKEETRRFQERHKTN